MICRSLRLVNPSLNLGQLCTPWFGTRRSRLARLLILGGTKFRVPNVCSQMDWAGGDFDLHFCLFFVVVGLLLGVPRAHCFSGRATCSWVRKCLNQRIPAQPSQTLPAPVCPLLFKNILRALWEPRVSRAEGLRGLGLQQGHPCLNHCLNSPSSNHKNRGSS